MIKPRRAPRPKPFANPKYERGQPRSGRMPLTLIDGSTTANAQRDLAIIAASFHAKRPCYAQALQRFAQQIKDGYTAALAVANYTTKPATNTAFSERTFADPTVVEKTLSDSSFLETPE